MLCFFSWYATALWMSYHRLREAFNALIVDGFISQVLSLWLAPVKVRVTAMQVAQAAYLK